MDLLNQIVHNDDGNYNKYNTNYLSENKFNEFLTDSSIVNYILQDLINEIDIYFKSVNKKLSPLQISEFEKLINIIKLEAGMGLDISSKEHFPDLINTKSDNSSASGGGSVHNSSNSNNEMKEEPDYVPQSNTGIKVFKSHEELNNSNSNSEMKEEPDYVPQSKNGIRVYNTDEDFFNSLHKK